MKFNKTSWVSLWLCLTFFLFLVTRSFPQPAPVQRLIQWPQFTLNSDSWQANGLIAWWPLIPVNDARDLALNGKFNLINTNNVTWITDSAMGLVPLFDNVSSQYFTGINPVNAYGFSVAIWFLDDDGSTNDRNLIQIQDTSVSNHYLRVSRDDVASNVVIIRVSAGVGSEVSTTNTYQTNTWNHVTGTFNSADLREVWLNADNANRGTDSANISVPLNIDSMDIGREGDSTPADFWSGSMADIRIYNRILSFAQIYALWHPNTRWDLYKQIPDRRFQLSPVIATIMRNRALRGAGQ